MFGATIVGTIWGLKRRGRSNKGEEPKMRAQINVNHLKALRLLAGFCGFRLCGFVPFRLHREFRFSCGLGISTATA